MKVFFICGMLISSLLSNQVSAQDKIFVIANNQSSKIMSRRDVLFLFTGLVSRWPDGTPVTVIMLPSSDDITLNFTKNVLNSFPYQIESVINRRKITGEDVHRIIVKNNVEMILTVKQTKGAIGYSTTEIQNLNIKVEDQ